MRIDPHSVSSFAPRDRRGTRLAAFTLLLLVAVPLAAQDTIRNDCCALLYSTGRWLGWSAAFLEYTRNRDAPTAADAVLIQSLTEAGANAQAANASCLQDLPAWPAWKQKQQWLDHHITELQKVDRTNIPDPSDKRHRNRRQLAFSAIDTTYELWAGELSKVRWNGDVLNEQTCATFYFQLGFALAAATQAFRQADESLLKGDEQAGSHQLAQTRLRLGDASTVLQAYEAMAHRDRPRVACADIGIEALTRMIETIAHRAPLRASYAEELRIVSGISDRVGTLLLTNCLSEGSGLPVDETAWIVNHHPVPWVFHRNGTVEAGTLWSGTWQERPDGVVVSITYQGVRDEFLVVFGPDGQSFVAYKNGQPYRHGVRQR